MLQQAENQLKEVKELIKQGKHSEALVLLEQITPIFETAEQWDKYVDCLNRRSECSLYMGKYDDTIAQAQKALDVSLEQWGEQSIYAADSYTNLGYCYRKIGKYNIAISFHEKSLTIRLAVLGEMHLHTAASYLSIGVCYDLLGNYNQAIAYYQKTLAIRLILLGEHHYVTSECYNNMGISYTYKGFYKKAIEYHEKALAIRLNMSDKNNSYVISSCINIGNIFLYKKDYVQSLNYYQKALDIQLSIFGIQHPITANLYNVLGSCYYYKGDIDRAYLYFYRALAIRRSIYREIHHAIAESYNNLANCYSDKEKYNKSIDYYLQALSINRTTLGEQHLSTAQTYNNLGNTYYHIENYTQALDYYQQALSVILTIFGENHIETAENYVQLSRCYLQKKEHEQALDYCRKSLPIWQTTFGEQNPNTANTYYLFAKIYQAQTQYNEALAYYQKALLSLALHVSETDYYALPDLEEYNHAQHLFEILTVKAAVFNSLYRQHQTAQDLAATIAHYQGSDVLIDQIRQSYTTEGSKLALAEKGKTEVYDAAISAAFEYELLQKNTNNPTILSVFNTKLGYQIPSRAIDLAFFFAEKSKSILLYAGIKDAEARINAQLPADLVQQEYEWRVELTHLDQLIKEEEYKKEEERDHESLNEWKEQYFTCFRQYDALIEHLEKDYPDYYRLKYDLSTTTIAQVQALLPPKTALINYVLDGQLYIITLTKHKCDWQQVVLPVDFEGLLEDFLFSFQQIGKDDYLTYGYDLYRHLILPIEETGALQGIERLLIIPDGILSRLPFEALPTEPCPDNTPYSDIPYFIHRYRISYHYSATLWINQQPTQKQNKPQPAHSFIGFAPVYSDTIERNNNADELNIAIDNADFDEKTPEVHRITYENSWYETEGILRKSTGHGSFLALLHSEKEVRQVANLFRQKNQTSEVLLHETATLNNFKALASQYRYILIAAHADYNGEKPEQTGIIFSPDGDSSSILYMGDAYHLQLQADLVVLSCCETGLGKINKGEGTMALNRGFLYSGAKNVVYTLFKVYDRESSELTTALFTELIAAQTTPIEALHQAKLRLIKRNIMPNKWAGFVLVGE